jgi:hypothetical protein
LKNPTRKNIKNKFAHLTNYSINKFNCKFQKNEKIEGSETYQERGHKRSLKWFLKFVDSEGNDSTLLWKEIKSIVLKTIVSIQPILKHYYTSLKSNDFWSGCCFEILGFDIMVSDRLKPYILEVNSSPSFGTDSQLDEEIKSGLVRDTFRLMNFSVKRKIAIIKEERIKLSKRMMTGKREKISIKERIAMKCKWIKQAEEHMIQETGSLGDFEKVFGVDEYVDFYQEDKPTKRLNYSCSETFVKPILKTKSSNTINKKRVSLTIDRLKKVCTLKKSVSVSKNIESVKLLNEGNCLGVQNRHKIFEFMRYAELFEKKAHISKSKRSKIDSLLLEDLKLMTQNDEQCLANKEMTSRTHKKNIKVKSKPVQKSLTLKKHKSCTFIGPKPHLKLNRENEAFHKLFNFQFYDRKRFLKVGNLCPMIKILFDLLRFLIDYELRKNVSSRLKLLKDFRWKRVCFCRLCSYLTKIEKTHQFVFVKLRHFLKFYAFPRAKPDSAKHYPETCGNLQQPSLIHESNSAICNTKLLNPISSPSCKTIFQEYFFSFSIIVILLYRII